MDERVLKWLRRLYQCFDRKLPPAGIGREILKRLSIGGVATLGSISLLLHQVGDRRELPMEPPPSSEFPPLVMEGGDPYIRALMRTISASESNVLRPYRVIYGGDYIDDLSRHPDRCIRIGLGPNKGNCSTAAGRYQMLTSTWQEKSKYYHPKAAGFWLWQSYNFEPKFQDLVVYGWLSDENAWGMDLGDVLREGKLDEVLKLLSGTWTSLGYGIEDNVMTQKLPAIYQQMLAEELAANSERNVNN